MTAGTGPAWYVVCPQREIGPYRVRAVAERRLAEIEALDACPHEHRIEER